ncbi:FAD-binding protein, partial [Alphaproteobacteria bacterium]|nr:FAD-binding protein [Alphaproteobacteria bacterium]
MVGGGLAALSAAISAADNGATVLLVNKGITGNS